MILHALVVDDEKDNLDSLIPGFVEQLANKLRSNASFRQANEAAGFPIPQDEAIRVRVSTHGYSSERVLDYSFRDPVHVRLHLCWERDGWFRKALPLIQDHFVAVVLSDLRFSADVKGAQAGRLFLEHVQQRRPEVQCILYSAQAPRPEQFPPEQFVRKASRFGCDELSDKVVEGFTNYLRQERVQRFAQALGGVPGECSVRGAHHMPLVYRSDAFGTVLRRLYDLAATDFGPPPPTQTPGQPLPTLLINGPTGAGKSQLARLLCRVSGRYGLGFEVACPAYFKDEHRLNSILFGHLKGAYTDAKADHNGLVDKVGSGVLLLEDLHVIDQEGSSSLHDFLETGRYAPLMGEDRQSSAALVATVESSAWNECRISGSLPQSFMDRVERRRLLVPPLAERRDDLACLVAHYCAEMERKTGNDVEVTDAAVEWLLESGLVGSVRQLQSFLKGLLQDNSALFRLDVADVEAHARRSNLLPKQSSPPPPVGRPRPPQPPLEAAWGDVPDLAVAVMARDLEVSPDEARRLFDEFFGEQLPEVWARFQSMKAAHEKFDLRLFNELLRYQAILANGNVARAARQLGVTGAALGGFVRESRDKLI
jgi:DNA-binding NtrC family response regulator